ncbi:hypothetical protein WA026_005622 [Henosepilachna vigintioctopunctata]|uniref:Serpin domain-containing protein n=1 Tax=Henosepilachna vigintioctopunctata TaxID=420089 RepID=A0AAW1U620_9CUCU
MKSVCLFLLLVTFAFGKNVHPYVAPDGEAERFNEFNVELFEHLLKDSKPNMVYSAFSLHKVLAMISLGAKGETAVEIKKALRLDDGTDQEIKDGYKAFSDEIKEAKHLTMETAIKAYVAEGLSIVPEMEKIATHYFDSGVEHVNFNKPEETAAKINTWVEKETHHKIKNLIDKDNIDPLTRFILANTFYFKGDFKHPFDVLATKKDDFHNSKTETVKVDMMKLKASVLTAVDSNIGVRIVSLPYRNKAAELVILLPDDFDKTDAMEHSITKIWKGKNLTQEYIEVHLPKFRVESSLDMIPPLKEMGVSKLFSRPDLSGMINAPPGIFVETIKQKTFVDVNEFGTEAAAATSVEGVIRSEHIPRETPLVIKVNRPFVFGILYDGVCLMAGKIHKF